MAPLPEVYFPPLEGCLSGETQLISWKSAFLRVVSPRSDAQRCDSLLDFLDSPDAVRALSDPFNPFFKQSEQAKSQFETKTAAINVANKSHISYNLEEIKSDALWLSEKAQIDQVSALRIAVLEWQNRPRDQLLNKFSEEEINSLQEAVGVGSLSNPVDTTEAAGILAGTTAQNAGLTGGDGKDARNSQLFLIFLSEKQHILKLSQTLLGIFANEKLPRNADSGNGVSETPEAPRQKGLTGLTGSIFGGQGNEDGQAKGKITVEECIEAVQSRMKNLEAGSGWSTNDADLKDGIEMAWQEHTLEELYQATQILFLQLQMPKTAPSSQQFLSWLRLMATYDFLGVFRPATEEQATTFKTLQSFISVTTLAFLKLPDVLPYFEAMAKQPTRALKSPASSLPAILSIKDIGEINELFLQIAHAGLPIAGPALFAWGMIMYSVREVALAIKEENELQEAQHTFDSLNGRHTSPAPYNSGSNMFEDIMEKARSPAFDDDFVKYFVSGAVDRCRVFDLIYAIINQLQTVSTAGDSGFTSRLVRIELLGLVRSSAEFLDYVPELVSSTLHILARPPCRLNSVTAAPPEERCDPRAAFVRDRVLMDRIFRIAKSRFPFEAVNFLKICRALSGCNLATEDDLPFIASHLQSMETYTQTVYPGFQGYRPIREDENANFVNLIQPLTMKEIVSEEQDDRYEQNADVMAISDLAIVPIETVGQVINESKPAVIMWHHQYNCLGFIGKWLERATNTRIATHESNEEIVTEAIGLLADLVTSAYDLSKSRGIESGAKKILEMASDGLDHYGDIVSVVFDIFERYLHEVGSQAGPNRNLAPLISCVRFLDALLKVIPGRVWPFLARSSLLASDGRGGMLATIVSGVEASSGDFTFLLNSIRLFESLVDDAITHSALRKTAGRVNARSDHVSEFTAAIPSYAMRNSLLSIVRTMVGVYNSNASWRYDDPEQQLQINASLTITFRNILYYVYGISDDADLDAKITGVLSTSAQYLLSILRPTSNAGLPFNPILRIILHGAGTPSTISNLRLHSLKVLLVQSALNLAEVLIEAGRLAQSALSPLEKQLFNASPMLIRLYLLDTDYRLPVITLLDLLVSYASLEAEQEPPSLLGHLGAESSCRLLDILSSFDKTFKDPALHIKIWDLLTTIVGRRQQWLAVYLLTGSSPRDAMKSGDRKDAPDMDRKPFLATSLDLLSAIDSAPLPVATSALNFVARAQEHWPQWVKPELKRHTEFFPKLVNHVTHLKVRGLSPYDQCLNTKVAYLTADICAIFLHSAKEEWDWAFFKTIIPLVSWFSENAVQVDGYNGSLHANMKRNFEMKYSGCSLSDIKRTSLEHPELGSDYFYDVDMGEKLYGYDFAWSSAGKQGFMEEVKRANLNLSLVETQVALLNSFKFFAIEHCAYFMPDRDIQKTMARVVRHCLSANSQGVPNENIFQSVQQVRAELAMALLQRLVDVRSRGSEVFGILGAAWEAARLRHPTYESALVNDDMEYYSSLLNIIFLALQFHVAGSHRTDPEALSKKPEVSSDLLTVLEIVKTIVAQGFRSLTTHLHENPQKCTPKDFAVLTAILQTALKVKDVNRIYERIAFHLADSDAVRYAVTLFSWSYQLTIEGDPVYGELSILFLLELSCVPLVAEQMAAEGILAKLSTYRLTQVLRQPQGTGPFDSVPRLFSIWNAGFLRICLNLLFHVGRTAPEVAAFLNQFEGQLRRVSEGFSIGHPQSASAPLNPSLSVLSPSQSGRGISLGMASEACSLALISAIIRKFRGAGSSAGIDAQYVQELEWNGAQVKDDIEILLEKRTVLRSRIAPTNPKEAAWFRSGPSDNSSGAESRLEEKIAKELKAAVSYIDGGEGYQN